MNKTEVTALLKEAQATRRERLELQAKADKLEQREKSIQDQLTAAKVATGDYGPYHLERKPKKVPRVTDWTLFHAHIKETGAFDMLTKHLSPAAIMARIDDGLYVPGTVTDEKVTYAISAK